MISDEQKHKITKQASEIFSKEHNVSKLAEENAELTASAYHFIQGKTTLAAIVGEIVDVELCSDVIVRILERDYPNHNIQEYMERVREEKLLRMQNRITKEFGVSLDAPNTSL